MFLTMTKSLDHGSRKLYLYLPPSDQEANVPIIKVPGWIVAPGRADYVIPSAVHTHWHNVHVHTAAP